MMVPVTALIKQKSSAAAQKKIKDLLPKISKSLTRLTRSKPAVGLLRVYGVGSGEIMLSYVVVSFFRCHFHRCNKPTVTRFGGGSEPEIKKNCFCSVHCPTYLDIHLDRIEKTRTRRKHECETDDLPSGKVQGKRAMDQTPCNLRSVGSLKIPQLTETE